MPLGQSLFLVDKMGLVGRNNGVTTMSPMKGLFPLEKSLFLESSDSETEQSSSLQVRVRPALLFVWREIILLILWVRLPLAMGQWIMLCFSACERRSFLPPVISAWPQHGQVARGGRNDHMCRRQWFVYVCMRRLCGRWLWTNFGWPFWS